MLFVTVEASGAVAGFAGAPNVNAFAAGSEGFSSGVVVNLGTPKPPKVDELSAGAGVFIAPPNAPKVELVVVPNVELVVLNVEFVKPNAGATGADFAGSLVTPNLNGAGVVLVLSVPNLKPS